MRSLLPIIVVAMTVGKKDTHPADQQASSKWPPWWVIATAGLALVGTLVVIAYGYLARPGWVGVANKGFWDYLELLIVPAALAIGVYLLNRARERERQALEAHREREREAEAEQREREREAAEEVRREREREAQAAQRERELEVENQRAQDAALQAYLDHMSQLLIDKDLRGAQIGDDASVVARARTLTVLPRLDDRRKQSVLQFLYESGIIDKDRTVIGLRGADLSGAHLIRADLSGANLRGVNLSGTNLKGAVLEGADLIKTSFQAGTNLIHANLQGANLAEVELPGAHLEMASLKGTNLERANLEKVVLYRAHLEGANLQKANLAEANLEESNLEEANLTEANLEEANLAKANLEKARGVVTETLEQQARSLRDTTMPNGQKCEDWLKDKES